jgi:hypothetical protein|tara:strand:+ start:798 stop:1037 length:240 start_codon:yes stop_codon:yes gene_type:complete
MKADATGRIIERVASVDDARRLGQPYQPYLNKCSSSLFLGVRAECSDWLNTAMANKKSPHDQGVCEKIMRRGLVSVIID